MEIVLAETQEAALASPQEVARQARQYLQHNLRQSFGRQDGVAGAQEIYDLLAANALAAVGAMQDTILSALERGTISHNNDGGGEQPLTANDLAALQRTLRNTVETGALASGRPTSIRANMTKMEGTMNYYSHQETRPARDGDELREDEIDPDAGVLDAEVAE